MIIGKLDRLAKDKTSLNQVLIKGLHYLEKTDFLNKPDGKYEVEGDSFFGLVQEYQTAPKGEKKAETHAKYIDIQYIGRGIEVIGFAFPNRDHQIEEDLLQEKDAVFYKTVKGEFDLIMDEGSYAIFFPDEIHRPGCSFESGCRVKKVVLKIAADLLK